ncbi:hypothetical protein RKD52_003033 [Metabacillus sp. SLBN-84]
MVFMFEFSRKVMNWDLLTMEEQGSSFVSMHFYVNVIVK